MPNSSLVLRIALLTVVFTGGAARAGDLIFANDFEAGDFRGWSTSTLEGTPCDDGNACTATDLWTAGICTGSDAKVCPPADACHFASVCEPSTGICPNPPRPDGTSCSIANACSMGADVCQQGLCVPAGVPGCETPLVSSFAMPAPRRATPAPQWRRPGESVADAGRRLLAESDAYDRERVAAYRAQRLRAATASTRPSTARGGEPSLGFDPEVAFDQFVGFWLLETIDDWNRATAIEFYRVEGSGEKRARFFDGTQSHLREVTPNDLWSELNPVSPLGTNVEVEVIGPKALRFHNTSPAGAHLSSDELTSTIRIQDGDPDVAWSQFWTGWDGTGDDPAYGTVENLTRYRRHDGEPEIQRNDQPSAVDWQDPVAIFSYVRDYFAELGQTHKVEALEQADWIGAAAYQALFDQIRTTGVQRVSTVSTAHRGGGYIGVWRTQFTGDFPLTTIHTAGFHHLTPASTVTITGFTGAYAVLNGTFRLAAFPPSSISESTPDPWQRDDTREHYVHIVYDSSGIAEPYDPTVHGIATLSATHGPVTASTGYRDLMAAILDFTATAFGPGTHTRLQMWVRNDDLSVPILMSDLQTSLTNGEVSRYTLRLRTYQASPSQAFYWNPTIVGNGLAFPFHNLNDPFGLGLGGPWVDRDIDLENYLDPDTLRNVYFTVTGPTLPEEPITSLLASWGYPSNGSRVVFQAAPFLTPPPDLVDAYGTHPWRQYASAAGDPGTNLFQAHFNLVGGIVRDELSCGRKVAYIRIGDMDAFDSPLYELATRSLVFGRTDMGSKVGSNWTAAMAALLTDLNAHAPERYILDIRPNGGGFTYVGDAFAALFGGDRPGQEASVSVVDSGLDPGVIEITGSGIQTASDGLETNRIEGATVDADEASTTFPAAVVWGTAESPVDVVILTSTRAASAGDLFPHSFLGSDPAVRVHDLGRFVTARIVGDIDGRLWSGIKGYDGTGLDPVSPDLTTPGGDPRTPIYISADAGLLIGDRHGSMVNAETWTQPDALLRGWYDTTTWQDLGLTPPAAAYPLGICTKPLPVFGDPSTWRDSWLEHAIVQEASPSPSVTRTPKSP